MAWTRGRPPVDVPLEQCCAVSDFLDDHRPIVGLPALQSHYTHLPRVVLGEAPGSFRDAWCREHRRVTCELEWTRPGAIWAMDFTHPPRLVDDVFPAFLNVVDLCSRRQLLWLVTVGEDSGTVRDALGDSFEQYDAPLVIKRDNGPAFRAAATKELLAAWPVFSLFSPPDCASYNGGCERANQTMRRMTPHMAERANQGDWWRSEDFHEARLVANRVRRPWGALGPGPDER